MKYLLLSLLAIVSTSCATIFNGPFCTTNIVTNVPMTAVAGADTIELKPETSNMIVSMRDSKPRKIVLINDTKKDTIALIPRWSEAYYLNFYPVTGFIIDGRTPKKWAYPRTVYLADEWIERNKIAWKTYPRKNADKGTVNLQLGFPYVNWFGFEYETHQSSAGFMGAALGLDYFYKDRAYLSVSGHGIANAFIPFPAAVDYGGIRNHMYSVYVSASNNHMLFSNRASVGYGFSFGHDTWNTINHGSWEANAPDESVNQDNIHRSSNSLGLVFPFCYYIKRSFYLGLTYRPLLVQFAENTCFNYQYTISFEFGWRIRLSP